MSDIWRPPWVTLAHPSLFTSWELDCFEKEILTNPRATEHDASHFFGRFPKFLYLGRGAEIRREVVLYGGNKSAQRVDFFRRDYGNKFWNIIEIKHPNSHFVVGQESEHPRLSATVETAISQAQDYRRLIDENPNLRAQLLGKGILVYRPQITVVVGRDSMPGNDNLRALYDRINQRGGIEAFTYDDLFRFAKEFHNAGLRIVVTHACFPVQQIPLVIAVLSNSHPVSVEAQRSAIAAHAEAHGISVVDTLVHSGDTFDLIRDKLDSSSADAVVTYRFDCLVDETLLNLRQVGEYFTLRRMSLHIVTEEVEFTSGYTGYYPRIAARTDMCDLSERLSRIARLRSLFNSYVAGSDGRSAKCPMCLSRIPAYDQVQGGGGIDYYAALMTCGKCGWYEVDGEFWTTDY